MNDSTDVKSYICIKTVKAKPMTRKEAEKLGLVRNPESDTAPDEKGYYVLYKDGYESWSPKDVFEDGYVNNELEEVAKSDSEEEQKFDFGNAIRMLKHGKKVSREGWNGKGMWLVLQPTTPNIELRDGSIYKKAGLEKVTIGAHIDMFTAQGTMQPGWLASQSDMLAEDWLLVD